MRINSVNISFQSEHNHLTEKKTKTVEKHVHEIPAQTPDYNVKTPLKYTKIRELNLPDDLKAHIFKLENGQKVVIVPKEGPTVLKTYVNTGSLNEKDEERGISHFVEHSLFNGSEGLKDGEFFVTVNKMGANTNASTGFSATDYYIKSNLLNDEDLEKQIKIHASMLETPKFTPEMTEKEKGPVTSEINMILDDCQNIATNTTIKSLFNIKSSSTDIIGGNVENINKLTREKVLKYYSQNYFPANMVTVITGEVNPNNAIALVSENMHSKVQPPRKRYFEKLDAITTNVRKDLTSNKTNSAHISMGFVGPQNNNSKDKVTFDVVQYLLIGSSLSRLNKSLEKIQAEASVCTDRVSSKPSENSVILLESQINDKKVEKAISIINDSLKSLVTNPPTKEELNIAKKALKSEYEKTFENSFAINSLIGAAMSDNNIEAVCDYEKLIDSIKIDDIKDFAQKYLQTNAITVIHPKKNVSFGSRKVLNTENITKTTFENNVVLYANNTNKKNTYVDLKLSIPTSKNPKAGTVEVLSYMLNRGSMKKNREDFYSDAEKSGILLSFSADEKNIYAKAQASDADIKKTLKDIKEVLYSPRLTQKELDNAKKQIIQQVENIPINAEDELYGELFKGEYAGVKADDILKNINKITLKDVVELYQSLLDNSQLKIAISGNFKNENLKKAVFETLSNDFPKVEKEQSNIENRYIENETAKVITRKHNKEQAEIQMGYKFPTDKSPKKSAEYALLNIILGGTSSSRLFNDLRESQKLAYHVKSSLDFVDDTGICSLYIKTTTDNPKSYKNLEKSIEGFKKHINKMINETVSQDELNNAKAVLKNRLLNNCEMTADKNSLIIKDFDIDRTNKILEETENISVQNIQDTAKEVFSTAPVYSIVATDKTLKNNTNYINSLSDNK